MSIYDKWDWNCVSIIIHVHLESYKWEYCEINWIYVCKCKCLSADYYYYCTSLIDVEFCDPWKTSDWKINNEVNELMGKMKIRWTNGKSIKYINFTNRTDECSHTKKRNSSPVTILAENKNLRQLNGGAVSFLKFSILKGFQLKLLNMEKDLLTALFGQWKGWCRVDWFPNVLDTQIGLSKNSFQLQLLLSMAILHSNPFITNDEFPI